MWMIVRTKPRFEKKIIPLLNELSVDGTTCPLVATALTVKVKRKWSDRIKEVEIPSVNGYIFVRYAEGIRKSAKIKALCKMHYVTGFLSMLTRPGCSSFDPQGLATISPLELEILQAAAQISKDSIIPAESETPQIIVGATVRIADGPLAQLNATFKVDDIQKDVPTLYIDKGIFKNAHFKVSKELLEVVKKDPVK